MRALALAAVLAAGLGGGAARAEQYDYRQIARNPFQLHDQTVDVTGFVEKVKRRTIRGGSVYYSFRLSEQPGGRYVAVKWYVQARGRKFADFPLEEGDEATVTGVFKRLSMKKVTKYLGNLEVYKETYNRISREVLREQRRRR